MIVPIANAKIPRYGNGRFGVQRTPTHRHQGIDIAAPLGTRVMAADDGKVVKVARAGTRGFSGYGNVVVIEHERPATAFRVWTLYAHLDTIEAFVGQTVVPGQQIGTVGRSCGTVENPGKLCGAPHLHFEVSSRSYPQASETARLDPTFFLRATL